MPPEVGQFLASILGGAVGLIFWPPTDWRGGFSQLFVSWWLSHYFSADIQRLYFSSWSIGAVRGATAFSAWALVTVAAWILKKIRTDPARAAKIIRKIADLFDDKP